MNSFEISNDILNDIEALQQRADRDGYLYVQDFVDKEAILETRCDITSILHEVGWLDNGTEPMEAISTQPARIHGTPEFRPIYDEIQKLESFHTLAHNEAILGLMNSLLGPDTMLLPLTIARVIFPTALEHTTPAHQDFIHIQGAPDVWTAWFPLGQCPQEMGGLGVLAGSHKHGVLPVSRSLGAGGLRTHVDELEDKWVSSPFNLGDVLFFHSHTVHQGLPNRSGNRLRLSVDYRYQRASDPITELVMNPHGADPDGGRLSWSEVYEGWKSDQYQYYWKGFTLNTVPREEVPVVGETEQED